MLELKINLDENLKKTSKPISQNVYEEILENFEKKGVLKKYKIDYCWGGTLAITVNRFPDFGSINNNGSPKI